MKNCSRCLVPAVVRSQLLHHPEKNARCLSQARLTPEYAALKFVNYVTSFYAELGIVDGRMVMSRPSQSSRQ